MAIEHWVTLVPDTKSLEKGIAAAFDKAKKGATVEVKTDPAQAEQAGREAGKAIDRGAKAETKDTGKEVGEQIDRTVKPEAEKAGQRAGSAMGSAFGGVFGQVISGVGARVGGILGKAMSGDIKGAARDVGGALDVASGALERLQYAAGSDSFVGKGIGKLKGVVDGAKSSMDTLSGTFSAVSSGAQLAQTSFQGLSSVVRLATGSQVGLNLAMLANPIGLVIAGIAALVAGLTWFFTQTEAGRKIWAKFTEVVGKAWDWVKERASAAWKWFESRLWPGIKTGVETAGKVFVSLRDTVGKVFTRIKEFIQPALDMILKIKDAVGGVVSGIGGFMGRLFGGRGSGDDGPPIRVGGGLGDSIREVLTDDGPMEFPNSLGGDIRGALSDAKQNEKDRRESERAAKAAQREAEREARAAQREADRAAREAARAGGGGGRGPASTGSVGAPARGVGAAMGGNLAAMMALAQSASGRTKYGPASDLAGGLADCSGAISDLVEVLNTGKSSPKRLFTTVDFATDEQAAKFGFLPGYMPGALNIGVTPLPGQSGHMAATLPNGVNFESGGGTGGGAQYGGNAAGALDKQFTKRYYRPVDGSGVSAFGGGGSVNPSSMPGFYAWVVPMSGDGAALAGGPGGPGGGASIGGGFSGGGGSDVFSQLRSIGEGGAKETFLPAGFSDPTSWPNVKSGMALLNIFGGMLGGGGQQSLIGDTRNLAPGELNPAITAGGSASLTGGAEGMMTQLTQGGVARQASNGGAGGVDNSINFNGPVDGDVSKAMNKANMARTARTRVTTGPLPL